MHVPVSIGHLFYMVQDVSWKQQTPRTIILAACAIANESWKLQGFDQRFIKQMIFDAARMYLSTHRAEGVRGLLLGWEEKQSDVNFCDRFAEELAQQPGSVNEFMHMLTRYAGA